VKRAYNKPELFCESLKIAEYICGACTQEVPPGMAIPGQPGYDPVDIYNYFYPIILDDIFAELFPHMVPEGGNTGLCYWTYTATLGFFTST
jgi:hypothetical protein